MSRAKGEKTSLLPPKDYDDDDDDGVPSIISSGNDDVLTDLEDDDVDGVISERPSADIAQLDREVLEDDYENDVGATSRGGGGGGGRGEQEFGARGIIARLFRSSRHGNVRGIGGDDTFKRRNRQSRRHRERQRRGEEAAEMMYEMEEGGQASQSPSRNSSELDLQKLALMQKEKAVWFSID
jgi:hypothetical protein